MVVELINTGSELMLGRVLNTHQQWLCRQLANLGYVVSRQVAIADTAASIQVAVNESLARAELIITTGGLGPTSDDLTRDLVAEMLGKKLHEDPAVLAHIKGFFDIRTDVTAIKGLLEVVGDAYLIHAERVPEPGKTSMLVLRQEFLSLGD